MVVLQILSRPVAERLCHHVLFPCWGRLWPPNRPQSQHAQQYDLAYSSIYRRDNLFNHSSGTVGCNSTPSRNVRNVESASVCLRNANRPVCRQGHASSHSSSGRSSASGQRVQDCASFQGRFLVLEIWLCEEYQFSSQMDVEITLTEYRHQAHLARTAHHQRAMEPVARGYHSDLNPISPSRCHYPEDLPSGKYSS